MLNRSAPKHSITATLIVAALFIVGFANRVVAHPLGNFTVNHFTSIEVEAERVRLHYVVDMAEIPTFQELQKVDADGDGATSKAELDFYLSRVATEYAAGLVLDVDSARLPLNIVEKTLTTLPGAGNLPTLRVECTYESIIQASDVSTARRLGFKNSNYTERIGWREVVVTRVPGVTVFNSSAFGNSVTDELKAYPEDMLAAPLDERTAELSFTRGAVPANATALLTRDGQAANTSPSASRSDHLSELISAPESSLSIALLSLLIAAVLGAAHAFSPGHGKTVVGAYLVGSRGTAVHAAFLGLTVTVTHTLGVFALGAVTLFASHYVVPERLYPILSFITGAIVVSIGLSLFVARLRVLLGHTPHADSHVAQDHAHADVLNDDNAHGLSRDDTHDGIAHSHGGFVHSHDGGTLHTHLPPGVGSRVTWRSLLALGVSGGLLPCPSALVVLLSAITLGRTGFGLLLVVAFSIGLAATLTAIGLIFVYAGRMMKRTSRFARFAHHARVVPTFSAFVIACVGIALCYEALVQAGAIPSLQVSLGSLFAIALPPTGALSSLSVLVFGFGLGLKHAVEADHMAAVSTIVSERRSLLSSSLVGGLWGVGHTISLFVVGVVVIFLRIEIGERTALALEFGVALMLITLGVLALVKLARGGELHMHRHHHGSRAHTHPHFHDGSPEPNTHAHHGLRVGKRPLVIGMVHGLAGSAALMLLVLSTIPAPFVALLYIVVFGIGSIGGMMLMSTLVGLPLRLTANNFARTNLALRGLAGLFSLCFGLFMVYEIGYVDGLFR